MVEARVSALDTHHKGHQRDEQRMLVTGKMVDSMGKFRKMSIVKEGERGGGSKWGIGVWLVWLC